MQRNRPITFLTFSLSLVQTLTLPETRVSRTIHCTLYIIHPSLYQITVYSLQLHCIFPYNVSYMHPYRFLQCRVTSFSPDQKYTAYMHTCRMQNVDTKSWKERERMKEENPLQRVLSFHFDLNFWLKNLLTDSESLESSFQFPQDENR